MSDFAKVGLMGVGLVVFDLFFFLTNIVFNLVNAPDALLVIGGALLFLVILTVNMTVGTLMFRITETMINDTLENENNEERFE